MAVKYVLMDGEKVSQEWYELLHDIRYEDGVSFHVNEGHRTMTRQTYFWNQYKFHGGNLAAFPSPFAPHIRTGRFDHAIDFNNAAAVQKAAKKRGVTLTLTVGGESWHLEANAAQLKAYAAKAGDPVIKRGSKNTSKIKELQRLMLKVGLKDFKVTGHFDLATRKAVRRYQAKHGMRVESMVTKHFWKRLRVDAS